MHFTPAIAATILAYATGVSAHTRVIDIWINGEDQGDGRDVYIRSPPTNGPIKDLTSADIVCNVNGATAVSDFVSAAAGDSSHKGPIITYIAPYTEGDGTEAIWSKIDEEGNDSSSQAWAVDNLLSNQGKKEFTLPSNLASGKYLVRQEIIGLHEADTSHAENSARGAQFYPSCAQFEITGSGTATPDEDFDFQTGYTETDPGIVFNLYGSFTSYDIPGPDVWDGSSSPGGSGSASSSAAASSVVATTSASPVETSAVASTTLATSVRASSPAATPTKSCKKRRAARKN